MKVILVPENNPLKDDKIMNDVENEIREDRKKRKQPSTLIEYFRPKMRIWEL